MKRLTDLWDSYRDDAVAKDTPANIVVLIKKAYFAGASDSIRAALAATQQHDQNAGCNLIQQFLFESDTALREMKHRDRSQES